MYDANSGTVAALLASNNPTVFNTSTINDVLKLTSETTATTTVVGITQVTPDANGNVVADNVANQVILVTVSDSTQTTVTPPKDAPVVVFQGQGGVNATFNDGPSTVPAHTPGVVDRIVVGTAGNDHIAITDTKNTTIILGTGNSTVLASTGHDTIDAHLGNSTISGGTGQTLVTLTGNAADYTVTVNNGHAVITNDTTSATTDVSHNIQVVQVSNNNVLVLANDTVDASVADLYHTTFGRDGDVLGLQYWFNQAHDGASLHDIAVGFEQSSEFAAIDASLNNTAFVQALYQNSFGRVGEPAGVAYWLNQLATGASRADLITDFAHIAGTTQGADQHQGGTALEAHIIGSVTIVPGIV